MPAEWTTAATLRFAALVCGICSVLVSSAAVALRPMQQAQQELDLQRNVLLAAGLLEPGSRADHDEVQARFAAVERFYVDRNSGEPLDGAEDDALPLYQLRDGQQLRMLVLPIEGRGLWSAMYGFLALDADTTTIQGIAFHQHGETPGLGGEVDNPGWRARWRGRRALDEQGRPVIEVIKGRAGDPGDDPHRVDGISGATMTSQGVQDMLRHWLGEQGYGPSLARLRAEGGSHAP